MHKKEHVALTHCFYCQEADKILLACTYNEKGEPLKDLGSFNHCVIDMEPCQKCADWMKKGIILIGIDISKSKPGWEKEKMPNPWRAGGWAVIKDEALQRIVLDKRTQEFALKHRFMFIEQKAMVKMGIVQEKEDESVHGDN